MNKTELLKHIGSVEQIGGIRDFTFNDGKAKGVRAIEINTGKIRFTVLPDRCMDISHAELEGNNVSWISKTGITHPAYYEKDGTGWLRGFYGGLIATCGLKNIGGPVGEHGLHGRIANIPASKVSVFADWEGDDYVMRVSGYMRECHALGLNLVLKRTITTKLFSDSFTVEDVITNEGFSDENISYCYHCNFGYPLVCEDAKIVGVPKELENMDAPTHGFEEKCLKVDYDADEVTVGIENKTMGAYITYKTATLPEFLIWKMFNEGDYVVGLEPRTCAMGGQRIIDNKAYVTLKPFEEYKTYLEFSFKKL